jgi:hypothetical protein
MLYSRGILHTMFLVRLHEDGGVLQELLCLGEETGVLVISVRLQKFVPREAVPDKSGFVSVRDMSCLMVDRIIPAKERVMYHTHVACAAGEHVALA